MTGLTSITPRRAIPMIADALQDGQSVMLWGPAGCAKSAIAREIAALRFDGNLIDIRLGTTPPENFHLPVPNRETHCIDWYPTNQLPNEQRDGARGILLLDEITSAPPAHAILGYQLALDRRVGDTAIPKGWGILAAGNRQGDKGITYQMPAPLANRFIHFLFDPEDDAHRQDWANDFCAHMAEIGGNPIVSAFIQFSQNSLYRTAQPGCVSFPSLRSWGMLARACDRADSRGEIVSREIACGTVGNTEAQAFLAFCAHKNDVPSFAEIVSDPDGAPCPDAKNLGACFFVVGMLCHHMTGANFAQCSRYLERLPAELDAAAVGMMKQSTRKEVLVTRAGQAWLVRVQGILA